MSKNYPELHQNNEIPSEYKKRFRLEFPNGGKIVCYYPFNSIQILFYDIKSSNIPDLYDLEYKKVTDERYLRALICRSGECEFTLHGKVDKLSSGYVMYDFSFGDNRNFYFTCNYFKGVEIIVQLDAFNKESPLYKKFKPIIKAMKVPEKEIKSSDDYISAISRETEKRLDQFMNAGFDGVENLITVAYLILLGRSLGADLKDKPSDLTESQLAIAEDIYDCLTNEYDKKWTAQYFANKYKVSDSTVKRYFRKVYGYGFKEYQTKVVMEHAAEILTTTETKISDISSNLGFADYRMFTSAFKKHYGLTPSEFRRRARTNN